VEKSIEELVKHERIWHNYLKSWGCNIDTAKDLIQEMYIQIDTYLKKYNKSIMYNEKEVNFYFVYLTLYNMFKNLKRAEKRVKIVTLENLDYLPAEETNIESDDYNNHRVIQEWFLHDDYIEMTDLNNPKLEEYDKNKMFNFYQRKVFEEVFLNNKSISQLSRDTNITYYSLYNTVKNIKEQIKKLYESKTWG
jgi:DNA-directed RNA polymerase specialized sigma24 family protein